MGRTREWYSRSGWQRRGAMRNRRCRPETTRQKSADFWSQPHWAALSWQRASPFRRRVSAVESSGKTKNARYSAGIRRTSRRVGSVTTWNDQFSAGQWRSRKQPVWQASRSNQNGPTAIRHVFNIQPCLPPGGRLAYFSKCFRLDTSTRKGLSKAVGR